MTNLPSFFCRQTKTERAYGAGSTWNNPSAHSRCYPRSKKYIAPAITTTPASIAQSAIVVTPLPGSACIWALALASQPVSAVSAAALSNADEAKRRNHFKSVFSSTNKNECQLLSAVSRLTINFNST